MNEISLWFMTALASIEVGSGPTYVKQSIVQPICAIICYNCENGAKFETNEPYTIRNQTECILRNFKMLMIFQYGHSTQIHLSKQQN